MVAKRIILDCDPGQDDAVALFLALASRDELDVLGVTAVAGNVPLALTARNARLLCDLAGRSDLAVYSGCAEPMELPLITAENVHGSTGIDGMDVGEASRPLESLAAVDYIVDTLTASAERSVTLVPTGPLTNIATAMRKQPAIVERIAQIVLMGGAMREGGNTTPSAEFNILVDPHAADIVLDCGRPIVMMGLDVTHQVLATKERINTIEALGNPVAAATVGMLRFFNRHDTVKYGTLGAPLHDPCTVAWLLEPDLFGTKACNVQVETESPLTRGHTAVDFWGVTDRAANVEWAHTVDVDGFFALLTERLARYG